MLLAKSAVIDSRTNTLSIFEIIEGLETTNLPGNLSDVSLIILFERNIKTDPAKIKINFAYKNNNTLIKNQEVEIDFEDKKRNRTTVNLLGIDIEKFGNISFEVSYRKKLLGTYTVDIDQVK